jgi:hypothetical protein
MLGPQHPGPEFVPEKVPLIAFPISVPVPVAEPLQGDPNVTEKLMLFPSIFPVTEMP